MFGSVPVSKPIVVMHLRASNFVGGPEKQILEHFSRLDSKRFRPILGTFVEDGAPDKLGDAAISRGFECIRFPSVSPLNPGAILNLARVLKNNNVDILCTHGYKPNVLGFFAAKLGRTATICISRGWTWESPKIRFYEAVDRRFLRMSDHVVAVSAGQQDKILACRVPQKKVSVIHNAINLHDCDFKQPTAIRQELGIPADALLVASAGRLSPEKNYASMIDSAVQVVKKDQTVYFAIFGEGFLRQNLEERIREAGLEGRFFLPGFRTDLQALFDDIDVFMLPSFTEGLPNVVLEAFAARKPVVATRVGGTPEVVQDGVSGFLTKPDEVALMVEHILTLAASPSLRTGMGNAGYDYIRKEFGFEKQTQLYEELYVRVAK